MTVADFFIKATPRSPENMTKESQIALRQTALAKIKMEKGQQNLFVTDDNLSYILPELQAGKKRNGEFKNVKLLFQI